MGVPKFYRWISERYPCLSSLVKEDEIPPFDNFYLDMNGIIHHCSHPNDADVDFRIPEQDIFQAVFHYIEVLFTFIRPQRVLYLAVDGVAPRAKMNQQRARRFRSAKDAHEREIAAVRAGKPPKEAQFDSNCITPVPRKKVIALPGFLRGVWMDFSLLNDISDKAVTVGTDFMERLDHFLQRMIAQKMTRDPAWQKVSIYYSSHLVPGEGEHKILDFVRFIRSSPSYDPYTRHCLYGLDADLIMLGLSVHEPFMSLLREEVKFGKQAAHTETKPEKIVFHLLHLSIMRDYLRHEFECLESQITFPFDLEKIIDDWILMGFLVGNDFIPHLPGLHINKKAFDEIYGTYKEVLPSMSGYINEGGYLNLARFQTFLSALEKFDLDKVEEEMENFSWMEMKKGGAIADELGGSLWDEPGLQDFQFEKLPDQEEENGETEDGLLQRKIFEHKEKYYKDKLRMVVVNEETLAEMAREYVRAIQWNLHYYYHGVPSWEWYYPYNYAPYISDLKHFAERNIEFALGQPFQPFQQLMAVLPARSNKFLPVQFHILFGPGSPIYDFYPTDFATDMNGKANEWEAVVLIPFIEEGRLIEAVGDVWQHSKLTTAERNRNTIGPGYAFHYAPLAARASPQLAVNDRLICEKYDYRAHCLERKKIRKGRHPALEDDSFIAGFPTLGLVKHLASLQRGAVQVFGRKSDAPSMVLTVEHNPEKNYFESGIKLLGKRAYVDWPHHTLAVITRVSDGDRQYSVGMGPKLGAQNGRVPEHRVLESLEQSVYQSDRNEINMKLVQRSGISLAGLDVLYYARVCVGKKYVFREDNRVAYLKPQWSLIERPFPAELVTPITEERDEIAHLYVDQLYPVNATVFLLAVPFYGCEGKVVSHDRARNLVIVVFTNPMEPYLERISYNEEYIGVQYEPAHFAARQLRMSPKIISRLTGTVFARVVPDDPEKENIGLNLKATKANTEMQGYTKRVEDLDRPGEFVWLYSNRVLKMLHEFRQAFPQLFEFWNQKNDCSDPFLEEVYPGSGKAKLDEIVAYLKTVPTFKMTQKACGGEFLDDNVIDAIQGQVAYVKNLQNQRRLPTLRSMVNPRLLYRYAEETTGVLPDPGVIWEIYDRVVNVRGGLVSVGLRGTVISIARSDNGSMDYITVLFDESFNAGESSQKSLELPSASLINISHGVRKQADLENRDGTASFLRAHQIQG